MFWGTNKAAKQEKALQSARQKISSLVTEHISTLGRRRLALIRVDAYGVVDAKGWGKECDYFRDYVVAPRLNDEEIQALVQFGLGKIFTELVEEPARQECARIEADLNYNEAMSPIDYEYFCANRLEAAGWQCQVTKSSGDQGVDVIGKKNNKVLVVQCKKYGSPVGNNAVQEVIAAKNFLKAQYAAVVSNTTFTRSAIELAHSTQTLLLNHFELDTIDIRINAL